MQGDHVLQAPLFPQADLALPRGHIQVAPVDGDMIAGVAQHPLLFLSQVSHGQVLVPETAAGHGRLLTAVKAQRGRRFQPQADLMGLPIRGTDRKIDHGNGGGKGVQIVRQRRRPEHHSQGCPARLQRADGPGGPHAEAGGCHRRTGVPAQEAVTFSVDLAEAVQRLGHAGPVYGVRLRQGIAREPDGKIGIVRDQGDGGKTVDGTHKEPPLIVL